MVGLSPILKCRRGLVAAGMNRSGKLLERGDSYGGILVRIVGEIADRERTDPDRLSALANVIEPDSLADLVRSGDDTATVASVYDSYGVLVESDGGASASQDDG